MDKELDKKKIDPSDVKQHFTDISIKLHCFRYWILSKWECTNMAYPFWRIYHNSVGGAKVFYKGTITEITPDKIFIIPPNTSFTNFLTHENEQITRESIEVRRFENSSTAGQLKENEVDQLFMHFNLGLPFDFVVPGIYTISVNDSYLMQLDLIKAIGIKYNDSFYLKNCLLIYNFITHILLDVPENIWQDMEMDNRIMQCIQYVQKNIHKKLENVDLAHRANMATNAFARLFKLNTGEPLQKFILKNRIEKARQLLHHSNSSIDTIATECGFCDRHHFSKAFKKAMSLSPGYYKQHLTML